MRLLIALIDWRYPAQKTLPTPAVWSLEEEADLVRLYLTVANGLVIELRVEAESAAALEAARGLFTGAGRAIPLSPEARRQVWLYQEGDEAYQQGDGPGGYFFINPVPQPDKFPTP